MTDTENKKEKKSALIWAVLIVSFVSALIYEFLTPVFSDDLSYMMDVKKAGSLADVFGQEVVQYMNWTGRSVSHIMLRIYLYIFGLNRAVFNVAAAAAFALLVFLCYILVKREGDDRENTHPAVLAGGAFLLIWMCGVKPSQTMFWMTGAFNYLFTAVIVLGFFVLYRRGTPGSKAVLPVAAFLAGWCNENTSGAAVLFALIMLILPFAEKRFPDIKDPEAKYHSILLRAAVLIAVFAGFMMQLLSPGNRKRVSFMEERHTGFLLYAGRFLKVLVGVRELFLPLFILCLFLLIVCVHQKKGLKDAGFRNALLFVLLFFATSFCLVLAPEPQERTYFGAGLFLIIATLQAFSSVKWDTAWTLALRDTAVCALAIVFICSWCENAGNLARVYREVNSRYARLEAAADTEEIAIPMMPEGFDNRYTMAYETDVTGSWQDFPNMQLGMYYRIPVIVGVPYLDYEEGMAP